MPFGEVLFTGEKYPKAAGDTGAGGFYKPYAPVSPDPFRSTSGGGAIQVAAVFESSCLPVRLFSVVTPLPEQRYPPRLVSACDSPAISMPRQLSAVCPLLLLGQGFTQR